jgi:hypothetical protein
MSSDEVSRYDVSRREDLANKSNLLIHCTIVLSPAHNKNVHFDLVVLYL